MIAAAYLAGIGYAVAIIEEIITHHKIDLGRK